VDDGQSRFPVCSAFNDESIYYNRRREDVMKYRIARRGDGLIAPFQCEERCWFVNLHGRAPVLGSYSDTQKQKEGDPESKLRFVLESGSRYG
jgi:hypothetical protein